MKTNVPKNLIEKIVDNFDNMDAVCINDMDSYAQTETYEYAQLRDAVEELRELLHIENYGT